LRLDVPVTVARNIYFYTKEKKLIKRESEHISHYAVFDKRVKLSSLEIDVLIILSQLYIKRFLLSKEGKISFEETKNTIEIHTSLYFIIKQLGFKTVGGAIYKRVLNAIYRLSDIKIIYDDKNRYICTNIINRFEIDKSNNTISVSLDTALYKLCYEFFCSINFVFFKKLSQNEKIVYMHIISHRKKNLMLLYTHYLLDALQFKKTKQNIFKLQKIFSSLYLKTNKSTELDYSEKFKLLSFSSKKNKDIVVYRFYDD